MTNLWNEAIEGAIEEAAHQKADRIQDNIDNCGRPLKWTEPVDRTRKQAYQFCKHWTCDYCNRRRGAEEQAQLEHALAQHRNVYGLFGILDKQWPRLMTTLQSLGVKKDCYRRLPQDDNKVTVFFVCTQVREVVVSFPDVKLMREATIPDADAWFDLARKRPGRRTSGTLGKLEQANEGDDSNLTSTRIIAVRGKDVSSFDDISAQSTADEAMTDEIPEDQDRYETLVEQWADAYESALRKLGYKTYRVRLWRKLDLSSLMSIQTQEESRIDVKLGSHAHKLAREALWPRSVPEI